MSTLTTPVRTRPFEAELQFTDVYRQYLNAHPAIREVMCLRAQFLHLFDPIRDGDLLAGRIHYLPVGFGTELASGGPGYYCHADKVQEQMAAVELTPDEQTHIEDMLAFWQTEAMVEGRLVSRLPADILAATSNTIAHMGGRLAGPLLDFTKLVQIGLPGLLCEIQEGHARAVLEGGDVLIFDAMRMAIDLLIDICNVYAHQAAKLADEKAASDPARAAELREMMRVLEKITFAAPETLHEAAQLYWLYALISSVVNYGRMDIALGNFYVADLNAGRQTETSALRLLQSWWQLMADRKIVFNGRVFLGGYGRPNPGNADRFALLAMEATRTVIEIEPQLTLRFYKGMNPALMQKALDVLGEGRTFPMLYNDDVNVPAVMSAFGVSREDAVKYLPYGCGEYALDHTSFGSPNCSLNMLKCVEAVIHNGCDVLTGERLGPDTGDWRTFSTWDDFWRAYTRQLEFHVEALAKRHAIEYEVERETAAFLYVSMLYDDCIERGKSLVNGGVRFLGGIIETMGLTNAADSLAAIKMLVYDRKLLTPDQMLAALDANFEGFERERKLMLNVPKYGNDDDYVDNMARAVSDHVCRATSDQAAKVGLDYYLVVNISNHANVGRGKVCAASPDGRMAHEPLANGNTPTAGNDCKGVTAFLNSLVKLDPTLHAGYTQNMRFNRQMFTEDRQKLEALLTTYWMRGGTQAMITVVSRGDLEAALQEPDKWRNLIVRVGGFSARFVELSPEVQRDLLKRTLY